MRRYSVLVAFRYDRGTLRKPQVLPGGRIRVDAHPTRAGVLEYRNPDGSIRREYRPPDEVFRADSLETLVGAPLTDDHPAEGAVTTSNADALSRGMLIGEPRRDGDFVAATIVVTSAPVIAKMQRGKVELSCGYEVDLDETPGLTPEGERYDAVQRNIKYNHVALVDVGRAGPQARVRMDAAVQVAPTITPTENRMNFQDEWAKAVSQVATEKARADAAELENKALRDKLARAEGERDAEKARADAAEKSRADAFDGMAEAVRARIDLEDVAKRAGIKTDAKMLDDDIKRAVIKRVDAIDIPKDKPAGYLEGFYEGTAARVRKSDKVLAEVREVANSGARNDATGDDDVPPEVAARAKMRTDYGVLPKLEGN